MFVGKECLSAMPLRSISTRVSRPSNLKSMKKYCCGIQLTLIGEDIQNFKNYG
jgi:hypothetical protein